MIKDNYSELVRIGLNKQSFGEKYSYLCHRRPQLGIPLEFYECGIVTMNKYYEFYVEDLKEKEAEVLIKNLFIRLDEKLNRERFWLKQLNYLCRKFINLRTICEND